MERTGRISGSQLVTVEDLQLFKVELFAELGRLLGNGKTAEKKWLKSSEVRKLMNISPGKLHLLRANRELAFMRIGGTIYYDKEDIEKMFEANKVATRK